MCSHLVADQLPLDRELKVPSEEPIKLRRDVADQLPLDRELKAWFAQAFRLHAETVADQLPLDRELKVPSLTPRQGQP